MSFTSVAEIEINKPLGFVRQYVFEPTNEPYWITGVIESHMLSVRPIGRGTQVQRIQKFNGRTIEYVYEIMEFDPAGYLKMLSLDSPVNFEIEYKINKIDEDKTMFIQTIQASSGGYFKFLDFLIARIFKRDLKRDMEQLKKILEK